MKKCKMKTHRKITINLNIKHQNKGKITIKPEHQNKWKIKDCDLKEVVQNINFNNNNLVMEVSANLSPHISHCLQCAVWIYTPKLAHLPSLAVCSLNLYFANESPLWTKPIEKQKNNYLIHSKIKLWKNFRKRTKIYAKLSTNPPHWVNAADVSPPLGLGAQIPTPTSPI